MEMYLSVEENSTRPMFLEPQELRIGNYINYENTTHVVAELHKEKIIHFWINSGHDGYVTTYNQVQAIPLTTREILDFGFEEDFDRVKYFEGYFDNNGMCIEHDGDNFWLCQHRDEDEVVRIAVVDDVHELQNLYYHITGKELTYS